MNLITNTDYSADLMEIIRLYFPANFQEVDAEITLNMQKENEIINIFASINYGWKNLDLLQNFAENEFLNDKKICKIGLYKLLSKFFEKDMPWGSLTGIRPTKLAHDMLKKKLSINEVRKIFKDTFCVSKEKTDLLTEIIMNQRDYINSNEKEIDLYINIPFCVSRCSYCSFISALRSKSENLIEPYIDALIKEIESTKALINQKCYVVKSIYIGGGTPTSFTAQELERILEHIGFSVKEFTIEAGRPDTITEEKLELFKKYGVTRICVNPQTFNDKVLEKIGRSHKAVDVVNVYNMARKYPFKINMDFIAGLPGDTIKSFKESIDYALALNPDSITVHTLCLKRASTFSNDKEDIFKQASKVEKMVDYARKTLMDNDYSPYYMYRQKNMLSGLENVSYARNKSYSVFNIDSMEESTSVIACGANGISKRVFKSENRIERHGNLKDIREYINRIDEMIEKKNKLFENWKIVVLRKILNI